MSNSKEGHNMMPLTPAELAKKKKMEADAAQAHTAVEEWLVEKRKQHPESVLPKGWTPDRSGAEEHAKFIEGTLPPRDRE